MKCQVCGCIVSPEASVSAALFRAQAPTPSDRLRSVARLDARREMIDAIGPWVEKLSDLLDSGERSEAGDMVFAIRKVLGLPRRKRG